MEVTTPRKRGRVRGVLVGVLLVLSCLLVVITGLTWWAHYTVLNTNGYIHLVEKAGKDPATIKALSDYVATQVVTATDLQQRTASALPPKAQFLAAPITGAVNDFIAKQTNRVLSSPQAYDLWIAVNRVAHEQIVGLLRGQNNYTYIQGSDVKLNTLPLISQVLVWIDGKLPGALASRFSPPVIAPGTPPADATAQVSQWIGRPLPADFGQITLLQNKSLGPAKTAVRVFDRIVILLPIVTALLIAATIWLSRRRRRTLIELGIGAAVALIVTYVIVKQASSAIVDSLHLGSGGSVVRNVVSASLGPLHTLTIWVVVVGVILAVVAWIVGRRDIQTAVASAGKRVVKRKSGPDDVHSPTVEWIERHAHWLQVAGLIVGLILLVFVASSWLGVILIIVLTLIYEGAISLTARQWPFGHLERGEGAAS